MSPFLKITLKLRTQNGRIILMGDEYDNISLYRKYMRHFVILLSMKFLALFFVHKTSSTCSMGGKLHPTPSTFCQGVPIQPQGAHGIDIHLEGPGLIG